jgi:hypothetical protein
MSGEVKAKTRHGEISLDQLAEIQPGMSKLMKEISERYYYSYYAAKGGNWKLAAHQMSQLRGGFRTIKITRPKYSQDLDEFDSKFVTPILKAIMARDWKLAEEAFMAGVRGSDEYHEKYGYGYIRFVIPKKPPEDLHMGPPEDLKR